MGLDPAELPGMLVSPNQEWSTEVSRTHSKEVPLRSIESLRPVPGWKLTSAILLALLLAAIVAIGILYMRTILPLVDSHQQPLVERAQRQAAMAFNEEPNDIARTSFPVVLELSDRTCVELRPMRKHDGRYLACYDAASRQVVEERVGSAALGR